MNIILIPGISSKGQNVSLSQRQLLLLGLFLLVILPVSIGSIAYRIQALLAVAEQREPQYLQQQETKLTQERKALIYARLIAESQFQALAQRLGQMQAQVVRLNAVGTRLVGLAGLDPREFNFQDNPAVGGPEQLDTSLGRNLDSLSTQLNQKGERLSRLENLLLDRKLVAEVTPSGWPVDGGWVSSGFGMRTDPFTGRQAYHEGVDIADKLGAPIHAMATGIVSYAGPRDGYGLMVEINHGRGQSTRYGHARAVLVKEGDKVIRGQTIALVGSSGRSTGPHLHFEVLRNERQIDPRGFLRGG